MDSGQIQQLGRYEILTRLSEGGFGEVYAACLRSMADFSTLVAIKLLHSNLLSDGLTVKSFADEARIGGRLIHPNITRVLGFEEVDGRYFLVMELVDGVSFGQLVHHQRAHGDIAPWTILEMIAQACDGLHHAHGLRDDSGKPFGLVHRDIKPSNLMLDRSGMVKVMDFGIAKAQAEGRDPTLTGTLKGTPAYMAPEMARGEKWVDHRADVFAMGAVLYELLTGQRLYQGSQLALIHLAAKAELGEHMEALAEVLDARVVSIVSRALAQAPEERFESAAAMARACRRAILDMGTVPEVRELAAELAPPPIRQGRSRVGDTTAGDNAHLTVLPWSARVPAGAAEPKSEGVGATLPPTIPPTLPGGNRAGGAVQLKPASAGAEPTRAPSPSVPLVPLLGGLVLALAIVLAFVLGGRVRSPGATPIDDLPGGELAKKPPTLVEKGPPTPAPIEAPTPSPTPGPTPTPKPPPRRVAKAKSTSVAPREPQGNPATPKPEVTLMVGLMVNTAPEEQPIWIDGKEMGKTPWRGKLPGGPHRIEVGESRGGSQSITLEDVDQVWLGIKGSGGWEFTRY